VRTVATLFGLLLAMAGGVLVFVAATTADEPGNRGVAILLAAGVAAVVAGGAGIAAANR
jgi:hypothetical protein